MGQVAHGGHGEDGPVVAHQVELAHVQAGLLPRRPHVARGHVLGHVLATCHDALHLTRHAPAQRAAATLPSRGFRLKLFFIAKLDLGPL